MNQPVECRSRRVQHFVDAIPGMLAACSFVHQELCDQGRSLIDRLERSVELRDASGRQSVSHCRNHYAYWGALEVDGGRRVLSERLRRHFDRDLFEVYEAFARAEFGAWRFEPGEERRMPTAQPVAGHGGRRREVVHASTTNSSPLRREALVAGWMVEYEGLSMLLLSCELDTRAAQKIERAADLQLWGDADGFRRADYEADVLALLLEPLCVDATRRRSSQQSRYGRVFLSPVIEGWGWGLSAMKLDAELQQRLAEGGLVHRGEQMPWHLAVARAETASDVADLMGQLGALRRDIIDEKLDPRHPIGATTTEALLPSAELMETVGLAIDGVLEEGEDYLELSLRQVGFECEELRQCGVDADTALEDTLRQTGRLSHQALEALGDAIVLARVRVRWTTILRRWLAEDSAWRQGPSLEELLVVVSELFRAQMWPLAVSRLSESASAAFERIATALCAAGYTGSKLCVGDLYEHCYMLAELDGVGPKTLHRAAQALADTLADWPAGPRWLPGDRPLSPAS